MPLHRILIVYGTSYGQTARIAARIRDVLAGRGLEVTLGKGDELPPDISVATYDGIVVGASLIAGRHQRYIERFVRRHRDLLNRAPSAFFSVSGSAGSPLPEGQAEARRYMERFLSKTGWRPARAATFGGAVAYTKYSPVIRWVMKRIARRNGGSTDTSRDHELTNWVEVERFGEDFASSIPQPARPHAWLEA